jgi:hypothetical protein
MTKTENLTIEPVAHILHLLQEESEYSLAYSLLLDYRGEMEIDDEDMLYIFENVVEAGCVPETKALIEIDEGWTQIFNTGFANSR